MENRNQQPDRSERPATEVTPAFPVGREDSAEKIRRLKTRANRGLITITVFIAVSLIAVQSFGSLVAIPLRIRHILGAPPSATLISVALIVYSFSAILMTLSRMTTGSGDYGGMSHVGFLTGFYVFYFFSDALPDNFWAVFAAGATVLGLEAYQIWNWCMEEIRREKDEPDGRESDVE
jgi:hypothetical protein